MALKAKFRTIFPALVSVLSPLVLVKDGLRYVFSLDIDTLKASFGTILLGPVTSRKGNIAFFNETTGTQLEANLAFNSGNPANAALYSQVDNPADGHVLNYSGLQLSIGDTIGYGEQIGQGAAGFKQALVGTVATNPTDNPVAGPIGGLGGAYGVMGYAKGNGTANVVGVGGYAAANVTNGNAWGANFVVHNMMPVYQYQGKSTNWMSGIEVDINVWKGTAGVERTHNNIFGIYIHGGGDSTTDQGQAVGVERLSVDTNARWTTAFASRAGAAETALFAGPATRAANTVDSQYITLQAVSALGVNRPNVIWGDSSGNFIFQSSIGGAHIFRDGSLNAFVTMFNPSGGSGVTFNKLNGAPGLAIVGATGVLNSTTTGAGVQTALGVNVGTNGAFVTRGGDLGSPSAVGTMPAFTLGGTIAGGANQINNIRIGAVTPLAGTFTTLQANTSLAVVNASPKTLIDANNNSASSPNLIVPTSLQRIQATDNVANGMELVSYGASGQNIVAGGVAGGVSGTPTGTPTLRNLLTMRGYGYNTSAWSMGGLIAISSSEVWTATANGTYLDFYTTPATTATLGRAGSFNTKGGLSIGPAQVDVGPSTLNLNPQTFASLPAAAAGFQGTLAAVSDSSTAVAGATITGGGANKVLAYCNGTVWKVAV